MAAQTTSIVSQGEVAEEPLQIYGTGPAVLRIGNGGAGHTGLLEVLCTAYLGERATAVSVSWIHNHSRNTQLALLRGYIDVALTYERDQEKVAEDEGWSHTTSCAFHDHFVLCGPTTDPLGLRHLDTLPQALALLAKAGRAGEDNVAWHARIDGSATMWKERSLWALIGKTPWINAAKIRASATSHGASWYQTSHSGPADALIAADKAGAYILTDRSTLLRQTALQNIRNTTVFFEPSSADDALLNSCYALRQTQARSVEVAHESYRFLDFLLGEKGQAVVASFGEGEAGFSFFAPAVDGFAKSTLRGGRPVGGRWTGAEGQENVNTTKIGSDSTAIYSLCVPIENPARLSSRTTQPRHPHFAIHDVSFHALLGPAPTITPGLIDPDGTPYFHEACVYIPSQDAVYVTSNQYSVPSQSSTCSVEDAAQSSEEVNGTTITISKLTRSPHDGSWTRTHVPTDVRMANGGVNYRLRFGSKASHTSSRSLDAQLDQLHLDDHSNDDDNDNDNDSNNDNTDDDPDDSEGILFCAQGTPTTLASLTHLSTTPPYATTTLLDNYHTHPFNSPNDVIVHRSGSIWFTDPSYGHAQGIRPAPRLPEQVYVFTPGDTPGGGQVRVVADGFDKPNGLCFGPDESILYVTDTGCIRGDGTMDYSRPSSVYAFDVRCDGDSDSDSDGDSTSNVTRTTSQSGCADSRATEFAEANSIRDPKARDLAIAKLSVVSSKAAGTHSLADMKASRAGFGHVPSNNHYATTTTTTTTTTKNRSSKAKSKSKYKNDNDKPQHHHLTNRRLFAHVPEPAPDGIKTDTRGNVYAGCGDGVHVWNTAGVLLGVICVPGGVANFCFGRPGGRRLEGGVGGASDRGGGRDGGDEGGGDEDGHEDGGGGGELFLCNEDKFWVVSMGEGVGGALLN